MNHRRYGPARTPGSVPAGTLGKIDRARSIKKEAHIAGPFHRRRDPAQPRHRVEIRLSDDEHATIRAAARRIG